MARKLKAVPTIKLSIGAQTPEGFTPFSGDAQKLPWTYLAGSVEEIFCAHFIQRVPGKMRGKLMDEMYRVLSSWRKSHNHRTVLLDDVRYRRCELRMAADLRA